jgi:hypothetical protein
MLKSMKKVIRINGVITTLPFTGHVEIRDIENYLQKMKEYTDIEIIYDDEYEQVTFSPYYFRLETDEEYATRMKNDAYFEETVRITELKELQRLKEKYEK